MTNNLESELNELKENLEIDKEEEKPRRGRRKKADIEREQELKLVIGSLGSSLMSLIIARLPNPIPLTDIEKQQIDIVTSNLLSKYMSYLDKWQEETAFITVMLTVLIPRTNLFQKIFKKREQKVEQKENSQ